MKPLAQCRLYTFVDTAYLRGRAATTVARQLCAGGSDLIQLRAKGVEKKDVLRMGREILPIIRDFDAGLVINDHWDIACELGADLCHLGQEDFFDAPNTLRRGPFDPGLGLSTHAPEQAARATAAAPAYIAIGPVFATPTKPTAPAVTLEYVRWAAQNVTIPWFAIGGINLENLRHIISAGATRICVVSAILDSPDIAKACRDFKNALISLD